jgi:hypothetical protein
MNKRFIFHEEIQLGDIGLIYHRSISEDKLVHEFANIFEQHQGIEQAGIL